MNLGSLGDMNGHIVGCVLKEAVRRSIVVIRNERSVFEATAKEGHGGSMDDVFTSADTKAQEIYLQTFRERFRHAGVIAEEANLKIEPAGRCIMYFTVDPLDGTKAYVRRQSHGVSTMVALVDDGEVVSAYVGDINTEEVYGYRPGSSRVHRITRLDTFEELRQPEVVDKSHLFGLLRDPNNFYSEATKNLLPDIKNYEVMGSSIGTWFARLWKQEVQVLFIPKGWETPWDSTPVIGISKKLGYKFFRPMLDGKTWEEYEPIVPTEKYYRDHDIVVVHHNNINSLFGK